MGTQERPGRDGVSAFDGGGEITGVREDRQHGPDRVGVADACPVQGDDRQRDRLPRAWGALEERQRDRSSPRDEVLGSVQSRHSRFDIEILHGAQKPLVGQGMKRAVAERQQGLGCVTALGLEVQVLGDLFLGERDV